MGVRICPTCGGKVSMARKDCIHCGYVFPVTKTCPDCGEDVDISVNECPICGYPFKSIVNNEEKFAEEKPVEKIDSQLNVGVADIAIVEQTADVVVDGEINEKELNIEQTNTEQVECPYCNSSSLMQIGIGYYMCETCKGKFLDVKNNHNLSNSKETVSSQKQIKIEEKIETPLAKSETNFTNNSSIYGKNIEKEQPAKRKKGLSKRKWITLVCCVILSALVGFGGFIGIRSINYGSVNGVKYRIIREDGTKTVEIYEAERNKTEIIIPDQIRGINNIKISSFGYCPNLISVTLGNGVTSIGHDAFQGCDSLTSIEIPDSVTSIGSYVFECCDSLTSVTLGNGLTSIGHGAFQNCDSLTSVTIGNSVTSIDDYAFYGCDSLTSVTIGNSVESIGSHAFIGCSSLTSIEIPDSVTSIGEKAFECCSSLTSIKYRGTEEQWSKISKRYHWDNATGSYTITYNYTGE